MYYHPKCPSDDVTADLLRVVRKGPAVKNTVDDAIDQCAEVFNLRDSIEELRTRAEQATDERQKRQYAQRGKRDSVLPSRCLLKWDSQDCRI